MNNEKGKKNSREVPENTVYIHAKVVETNFFLSMGNWKKKKLLLKILIIHIIELKNIVYSKLFLIDDLSEIISKKFEKKIETFHE